MTDRLTPICRVVTGTDARGRSRVLFDGAAPNVNPRAVSPGAGMTDVWVFDRCPAVISGERDDGNLPFSFEPPERGGHLRIVQSMGKPPGYDAARDTAAVPLHAPRQRPGGTWDRGGQNAFSSPVHRSATVDYGILLSGERVLLLDDGEHVMRPGDVVVQLGNWHGWTNPRSGSLMAFVMMGACVSEGASSEATGLSAGAHDTRRSSAIGGSSGSPAQASGPATVRDTGRPSMPDGGCPAVAVPDGVRPVRRIVTVDDEHGTSMAIQDGPSPDVRTDPARPGFATTRIWVTEATPARFSGVRETLHRPHTLEPPPGGSVCRVVTFPPDDVFRGKVGAREVEAFFRAMGSPGASTYSPEAPHPYMQRTRTLDLCLVLDGEITLVLDTAEVRLKAGDTVVQRGTNHAWSNRTGRPAVVAISSHDAIG